MVVFFFKNIKKGRELMQMYRVVPPTNRGNYVPLLDLSFYMFGSLLL